MLVNANWVRRIAVVVFVITALLTVLCGLRTYGSFLLLRSAYAVGVPMTSSIRPWMTLNYFAAAYLLARLLLHDHVLRSKFDFWRRKQMRAPPS